MLIFYFLIYLQVLTETDHCYCVLLNAHDGAAFPSEKTSPECGSSNTSSLRVDTGFEKSKNTKVGFSPLLMDEIANANSMVVGV